jgi:hypothetical protein
MFTLLAGILRKLKALSVDVYVDLVTMLTYAVLMVFRIGGRLTAPLTNPFLSIVKEFQLAFSLLKIVWKEEVIQASWFLESKMRILYSGKHFLEAVEVHLVCEEIRPYLLRVASA